MANLDVIEFDCPRCLNTIRVAGEQAGQRMDCPSCLGSLLVPSRSTGQDQFEDIFDSDSFDSGFDQSTETKPDVAKTHSPESIPSPDSTEHAESDSNEDPLAGISIPQDENSSDDSKLLPGGDPFEIADDAPLKIEGIGDVFGHADVYGTKCNICDTRIHVRPDQAKTYVECPECFSKVLVEPPSKDPKPAQRWVKEGRDKRQKNPDDEELKLSDPVERPTVEIDASYGLDAPTEDLLAPRKKESLQQDIDHRPGTKQQRPGDSDREGMERRSSRQRFKSPPLANRSEPTSEQKKSKSRRELYEESQRRQQTAEVASVFRIDESTEPQETTDFPAFEFGSLLVAAINMIKSPGVVWRALLAIALMCFGVIVMESYLPASMGSTGIGESETLVDRLKQWAGWGILGGFPYVLGVLMLWFVGGYIFRDAALGRRRVANWKNAGVSELTGTFLLFSFGFFVAGLPALFLTWFAMPLRVFLGPLLLLGAWYNRAPFSIINVDAFRNFTNETGLWIAVYKLISALAFCGFIAGMLFVLRGIEHTPFNVSVLLSVSAVVINAVVTLVFAAVSGWHCGRVVEGLHEST